MGSEMCIRDRDPTNANGISIILLFWGITAGLFIGLNRFIIINRIVPTSGNPWPLALLSGNFTLEPRPLYRNVPEGAEVPIDTLPGGEDPFIVEVGEDLPETFIDDYGETKPHTGSIIEAEIGYSYDQV